MTLFRGGENPTILEGQLCTNEFGFFGSFIGYGQMSETILNESNFGILVRSKQEGKKEGGILAGDGFISPLKIVF